MTEAPLSPAHENIVPRRPALKKEQQRSGLTGARVDWLTLAEALRNELAEYGGFSMLLSKQRTAILLENRQESVRLGGLLEEQISMISHAGYQRARQLPGYSSPAEHVLHEAPLAMRPLFEALLDETARLREVVQEQLQHNKLLMQQVFGFTSPNGGALN